MYKLDIELLHYINELLVDRERLLEERELDGNDYELNFVLKQETIWEIDTNIKGQKIITKLIEEQIDQ
jgi:thiamine monophosphate kinase